MAKEDRPIGSYKDKIQINMQQQIRNRGIDGKNYLLWWVELYYELWAKHWWQFLNPPPITHALLNIKALNPKP